MNETPQSPEVQPYHLNMIIHRHGPKQDFDGPLTEQGEADVREYFEQAYKGVMIGNVDVESSPILRTQQTARLFIDAIQRTGSGTLNSEKTDERLSEGGIAGNKEVLHALLGEDGRGGKWISRWLQLDARPSPEVKTGKEAVAGFSSWILEKVRSAAEKGGNQEIDAFSHGPVMAAFLIMLQEKTNSGIFPADWQEKKVTEGILGYLSSMQVWSDSSNSDVIHIAFAGQTVQVPVSALEELIRENSL